MPVKKSTNVKFGNLELDLRLTGRNVINIESRLKQSMVGMFLSSEGGFQMPPANKLLIVLQGANNTHGITDEKIADAFDLYLEQGNTTMDLMAMVQNLLDQSGFLGKKTPAKKDENAVSGKVISLDEPALVTGEGPLD